MRPRSLLLAVLTPLAFPVVAQQTSGDGLVGLWGTESLLGPAVRGLVLVEEHDGMWTAQVAGMEGRSVATREPRGAAGSRNGAIVSFPGRPEQLRLLVEQRGRQTALRGFWVQPAGNLPAYATPLSFVPAGPGRWRATITPLDERFSLFLQVTGDSGGALRAVARNPDYNWGARWPWFRLELLDGGTAIALIDPATGRQRFAQPYDSAQRRITFDFGALLVARPLEADAAPGFYPRPPHAAPYQYRVPADLGDGWRVAAADRVGLDAELLSELVRAIGATNPADVRANDTMPRLHSLLVARHGQLVLDEYFYGYAPDRPHDLRSASKTFTSVMAGIAMRGHPRFRAGTPLADLMPRARGTEAGRATIGQFLTHTSGLACDDDDDTSPGNEDTMQAQSTDWYGHTLALPRAHPPGERYAYCSAGINLVGGAIAAATGEWLPAFFERELARPLGIPWFAMNLMPSGEGYAGGGMHLRPRDFLKFGELYLRGGVWNGRRVVGAEWVQASTARQVDRPDDGSTDGYAWHRHTLVVEGQRFDSYEAGGNGGQFVTVIPALDLVVATTAGNYGQYRIWRRIREELVPRYVMAAVRGR